VAARMFEAMAAGAAVVTERRLVPHLASLGLVDGWHYISCDESLEGLWNGLGFLLGNNDSRVDADVAALAARGQALVKQRFSTLHEQRAVWAAISAPASGCSLTQPTTPALVQGAGLGPRCPPGAGVLCSDGVHPHPRAARNAGHKRVRLGGKVDGVDAIRAARHVLIRTGAPEMFAGLADLVDAWVRVVGAPGLVIFHINASYGVEDAAQVLHDLGVDTSHGTTATLSINLINCGLVQGKVWLPGVPYIAFEGEQVASMFIVAPGYRAYLQGAVGVWAPCPAGARVLAAMSRRPVWSVPLLFGGLSASPTAAQWPTAGWRSARPESPPPSPPTPPSALVKSTCELEGCQSSQVCQCPTGDSEAAHAIEVPGWGPSAAQGQGEAEAENVAGMPRCSRPLAVSVGAWHSRRQVVHDALQELLPEGCVSTRYGVYGEELKAEVAGAAVLFSASYYTGKSYPSYMRMVHGVSQGVPVVVEAGDGDAPDPFADLAVRLGGVTLVSRWLLGAPDRTAPMAVRCSFVTHSKLGVLGQLGPKTPRV
jgi:hypothetical protein